MSQEKVNKYKEEKRNRKKLMQKEKRRRNIGRVVAIVVLLLIIAWVAYSIYLPYARKKENEVKTHVINIDSFNNLKSYLEGNNEDNAVVVDETESTTEETKNEKLNTDSFSNIQAYLENKDSQTELITESITE